MPVSAMAASRSSKHPLDFRAFRKPLRLYFYSSMSPPTNPHASVNNLQTGVRVALFGMIVKVIFAAAKILGGLFGHVYVLMAAGIASRLAISSSFVICGGWNWASRPPDD